MGGHKTWLTAIPTGSCWGLFGGALSWAPSVSSDGPTFDPHVVGRRGRDSSDEVVVIDLAGVERDAPGDSLPATSLPLGSNDHPVGGDKV